MPKPIDPKMPTQVPYPISYYYLKIYEIRLILIILSSERASKFNL